MIYLSPDAERVVAKSAMRQRAARDPRLCTNCGKTIPSVGGYVETFDCRYHYMTREQMLDEAVRRARSRGLPLGISTVTVLFPRAPEMAISSRTASFIRAEFARIAEREMRQ